MRQPVIGAHRHQNIARCNSHTLGREFRFLSQVELIKLHVCRSCGPDAHAMFRNFENAEQQNSEDHSGNRGRRLGKQVDECDRHQNQSDQPETDGDFFSENNRIEWHAVFAVLRVRVTQHQHRHTLHRKTPNHAKRIQVSEECYVAAAYDDGHQLKRNHKIDDPVRRPKSRVRMPEPIGQYSVFRHAVQHAV